MAERQRQQDRGPILAITTSAACEVALLHDERMTSVAGVGQTLTALLPAVQTVLGHAALSVKEVALIAVCVGPGSFTGLRIGVAFAKTLAQAQDIAMAAISAYDVAAYAEPANAAEYPLIAVAQGKSNYYYARLLRAADDAGEYFALTGEELDDLTARVAESSGRTVRVVGADRSSYKAGERAERVALLACRERRAGRTSNWPAIRIDYGQRPNAVINWERRQARTLEGHS